MLKGTEYCVVCKKVGRNLVQIAEVKDIAICICQECAEAVMDTFEHWDEEE